MARVMAGNLRRQHPAAKRLGDAGDLQRIAVRLDREGSKEATEVHRGAVAGVLKDDLVVDEGQLISRLNKEHGPGATQSRGHAFPCCDRRS